MSYPLTSIPGVHVTRPGGGGGGGGLPPLLPGQGPVANSVTTPAPLAQGLAPVFNVHTFGAVGDGVANDGPAILAADAAAALVGGTVFFPNRRRNGAALVAYGTLVELAPTGGANWTGEGTITNQSTIRALGAIRAVISVQTTAGALPTPTTLAKLTLDQNGLATHGLLSNSDWLSRFTQINAINAPDGRAGYNYRCESTFAPITISAVTQTGPGPAIALDQPDPLYTGLSGTTSLVLKVGPDATHFTASFDNGATFQTAQQFIPAGKTGKIAVTNGAIYQQDTGVRASYGAGAYTIGTTYAFTVTVPRPEEGNVSINVETRLTDCWGDTAGAIFATAGLTAQFSGALPVAIPTVMPGTVSRAAFGQVFVGDGTCDFMSTGALPGDFFFVPGVGNLPIASILDDNHIAAPQVDAADNAAIVAGVGIAIGVGACYREEAFAADNVRRVLDGCKFNHAPILCSLGGDSSGSMRMRDCRLDSNYAFNAVSLGANSPVSNYLFDADEYKVGSVSSASAIYIGAACGGTILEPRQATGSLAQITGPGSAAVHRSSIITPYGPSAASFLPLGVISPLITFDAVNAANFQFAAPTFNDTIGSTSLHYFTMAASFVMTGVLIPAPSFFDPNLALTIILVNTSTSHTMVIQHDFISGSHLLIEASQLAIGPNESIRLVSLSNGKWQQLGGVGRNYQTNAGSQGAASRIVQTSDATVTPILDGDSGFLPGTLSNVQISANDLGTGDNCFWDGLFFATNNAGALIASNFPGGNLVGTNPPIIFGTGGLFTTPPFGWTNSATISGSQTHVNVIGAVGHNVVWRANVRQMVAARTF